MALPQPAIDHYQQQQQIAIITAEQVNDLWRGGMGGNFDLSWSNIAEPVFATVMAGQRDAAATGIAYVPAVLAAQGIAGDSVAKIDASRFMGGTDDGRPLETLLHGAVYESKTAMKTGVGVAGALSVGGAWLQDALLDAVRDANRQAVASAITVTPKAQGWVRMMNPPSCKFCIMLAGKFYKWNQGFQSHPDCDCRHIPSSESVAGDLTVDPYAYFHGLTEREQNQLFGKNDAAAIRDGGDMYRIVNTRGKRGLADNTMKHTAGRNRGWQARRYDSPSKMTIDEIYATAKTRDDAIRLMGQNGFITGEQVAGGNILGNSGYGYAGALGRGGTRKGATSAYQKAASTGVRDPLEPATQTAAERRLHSAVLIKQAADRGSNPFGSTRITQADRDLSNRIYEREIAKLDQAPEQVRVLARLLRVL